MKYLQLAILLYVCKPVAAQTNADSTARVTLLRLVQVETYKYNHQKDAELKYNIYQLSNISNALSNKLQQTTLANVRNYGPSQLSTISIRGLGSQHVANIWNGLNVSNNMHGTADASLFIPYSILTSSHIKYGSSALMGAVNNVAGSILQSNTLAEQSGLEISSALHFGSFNKHQQYIGVRNTAAKTSLGIEFFHESARNNFPYKSNKQVVKFDKTNTHSKNDVYYVNALFHRLLGKTVMDMAISYNQAYREIAPAIYENKTEAVQRDKQLKAMISFNRRLDRKWTADFRTGYIYEKLDYVNPIAAIQSSSVLHKNVSKLSFNKYLHRDHYLDMIIDNNFSIASSKDYSRKNPVQNIASALVNYTYARKRLQAGINLKQQIVNSDIAPFLFDVHVHYKVQKNVQLFAKASRIYRYPTLNDLFWNMGANEGLLPEKGWSAEYSVFAKVEKNQLYADIKATNFYYWINNWIQWTPSNLGYWTPKNTKKVFSRGIELQSDLSYKAKQVAVDIKLGYTYILPTQVSEGELYGKQLIYEPNHKAFAQVMLSAFHCSLQYSFQYTASRYTSSDNAFRLDPFQTNDLRFGYSVVKHDMQIEPYLAVQNLSNTNYQMMQGRPMMGRNYTCGIIFHLQSKSMMTDEK